MATGMVRWSMQYYASCMDVGVGRVSMVMASLLLVQITIGRLGLPF